LNRSKRVVEREHLIKSYKKRITDFVVNLDDKSILKKPDPWWDRYHEYEPEHKTKKFLATNQVRSKHKFEKDRVLEIAKLNESLIDSVPAQLNASHFHEKELRPRDRSKEAIHP
jgi:hypothetical protein